jgi:hypothetical protein
LRLKTIPFPAADLLERFDYDPLRGVLINKRTNKPTNKKIRNRGSYISATSIIKYTDSQGLKKYYNTTYGRLVYTWVTGAWPDCDVDHKDRDQTNNRFWNLRLVTRRGNCQNRTTFRGGVQKIRDKWRARIRWNGKQKHIGMFLTREEAEQAYLKAADRMR